MVAICDHLKNLKYSPYLPYVFTEHGTIMLANVLNSKRAILVSVRIIEIFIRMREYIMNYTELQHKMELLEKKVGKQDQNLVIVFKYLKKFSELQEEPRKQIGY